MFGIQGVLNIYEMKIKIKFLTGPLKRLTNYGG